MRLKTPMRIELIAEYALNREQNKQLLKLEQRCFPDYYRGRTYFKQVPHFRLLALDAGQIIGQAGIDYRVMSLNENPIRVWGYLEVCVDPEFQGKQIAGKLLQKGEEMARKNNIDFMLLFADDPRLYLNNGFMQCPDNQLTWLKIDEHKTLGIANQNVKELMIKAIAELKWEPGDLDMMGYLY